MSEECNAPFTSYESAIAYLGNKSNRPYRPTKRYGRGMGSPRSTRVVKTARGVGIQYHDTVVVEYTKHGIVLNTGGFRTVTTKARLNSCLDFISNTRRVYQKAGVWYYGSTVFVDGLTVGYDGKIAKAPSIRKQEKTIKESKRLSKLLDQYIATLKEQLENDTLEAPSAGDCWHCLMVDSDGTPLGERAHSDHLISHLEECYIVPSLIAYIAKTRGSMLMRQYLSELWNGLIVSDWGKRHTVDYLPQIVRRYFRDHMTPKENRQAEAIKALDTLINS